MDLRDAWGEAKDRVRRRRAWMDRRQPIHLPGYGEDPRTGMETATHHSARHRKNSGVPHSQPARSRHAPMNVGVLGLWHLGSVTAAGLAELTTRGLSSGNLRFSSAMGDATDMDLLWVTYDTPVDARDNADTEFVM